MRGVRMFTTFNSYPYIHLLKFFIILQPIIDILTYFSITYLPINITIGIAIRVLFMVISLFYIFFGNNHRYKRMVITYLILLFTVIGISFILNFFTKPQFYFFSEVQYVVKAIYFPILFCTALFVFTDSVKGNIEQLLSSVSFAMTITALSLFFSILTNTSSTTYEFSKLGYSGWFFAGNEISAIIAICFPLLLIYSMLKTRKWKDVIYWIPTLLIAICALLIGTKVSFLAIFATLIIAVIFTLIHWLINLNKQEQNRFFKRTFFFTLCLAIIYIAVTPNTPAFQNLTGDYETMSEAIKDPIDKDKELLKDEKVDEDPFLQSPLMKILLSSRNIYFEMLYTDYVDTGILHKLFGIGYAGFYDDDPKLVEMDFFDLFFSFGIIGFLFLMAPLFFVLGLVVKYLFTRTKVFFQIENILLMVAIGLGLGIAFFAGHVLYAPAVSIYLALALVLLIYNFQSEQVR